MPYDPIADQQAQVAQQLEQSFWQFVRDTNAKLDALEKRVAQLEETAG